MNEELWKTHPAHLGFIQLMEDVGVDIINCFTFTSGDCIKCHDVVTVHYKNNNIHSIVLVCSFMFLKKDWRVNKLEFRFNKV